MNKDTLKIGNYVFNTLVAVTAEEQGVGLMNSEWPPPIMCFPSVHKIGHVSFWMKNTPSPLDIIFAYQNRIADIKKGEPYSTDMISSNSLTDLVIELPFGTVSKLGIKAGDPVKLIYSAQTAAKIVKSGV